MKRYTTKAKLKILAKWDKTAKGAFILANEHNITERTLWRWLKAYKERGEDGLINKCQIPHTPHPNSHTEQEIALIKTTIENNPNWQYNQIYGYLKQRCGYKRTFWGFYNYTKKFRGVKKYDPYVLKDYDTPRHIGEKIQVDVKFVPKKCHIGNALKKFNEKGRLYQYTAIDEATREVFVYAYQTKCSETSADFVDRLIAHYGYVPKKIQTDNGSEFRSPITRFKSNEIHKFVQKLDNKQITHGLIKPNTPRHNGKVERFHRTISAGFYVFNEFDSVEELNARLQKYMNEYNEYHAHSRLTDKKGKRYITPNEKRKELLVFADKTIMTKQVIYNDVAIL